ncbi:MAG TPA: bifunctional 5,10-methylenetetrahydrofolate dehydrogenase/5,10-methenyltetrahydrofolate cyclohydrolase [Patescibacteria group bacterium]|nr:bifunctional 5,10-methylenetetrahydrofolate dehydrogenase/5,10-methenyltetrahydrofolate cyclohydrolase [Patescibacteria group bacterium]
MAIIFDGRKFAAEKEVALQIRVLGLKTRGVHPKLASILVGKDLASELYVNLKKKAAERIGAEVDIYKISENSKLEDLKLLIKTLNEDEMVNGIMIQMPIPGKLGESKEEIVSEIDSEKDVDGLKEDSQFLHPTSKAIMEVLKVAERQLDRKMKSVCVVGATGMVGKPLVKELKEENYEVIECNTKTPDLKAKTLETDVVVSVTGSQNIITGEMVKDGVVVIDVGSPQGDVDFASVSKKADFISPVPGGVGPVTITCLLENLISAC